MDSLESLPKISRRKFLKILVNSILAGLGIAVVKRFLEFLKNIRKEAIENSAEAIYYILTGEKENFQFINERNYEEVLVDMKNKLIREGIKVQLKKFANTQRGLEELEKDAQSGTAILLLWPISGKTPTLGLVEAYDISGLKAWDPFRGYVEYRKTLSKWIKENKPIVYLFLSLKRSISDSKKIEIQEELKKFWPKQ